MKEAPDITTSSFKHKVTMRDIAQLAGVSQPVVSAVINENYRSIKVSEMVRAKVQRIVKNCNYHPNAIGRALSKQQTGHIGFVLSDTVADGLANAYYANCMSGIERVCRERGYSMVASVYNLSNIESFVFPSKVRERSVDGLILSDYVKAEIVGRFKDFGVPCVSLGDTLETVDLIPSVSADFANGLWQAVEYAVNQGHMRIGIHTRPLRRVMELNEQVAERARQSNLCTVDLLMTPGSEADYTKAQPLADLWFSMPSSERPTVLIATDQVLLPLIRIFRKAGIDVPGDVGLISTGESRLCEFADPPITSIYANVKELAGIAATMLIEHLENGLPLTPECSKNDYPCTMLIRESVASRHA